MKNVVGGTMLWRLLRLGPGWFVDVVGARIFLMTDHTIDTWSLTIMTEDYAGWWQVLEMCDKIKPLPEADD